MRKLFLSVTVTLWVALLPGCSSVKVADKSVLSDEKISYRGTPVAHVEGNIWGLYFFQFPIVTGSAKSADVSVWFKDTVTVENAVDMITAKAAEMKADSVYNIVSEHSANPCLFGIKEVKVSANIVE